MPTLIRRGHRLFAVPKQLGLADRIAAKTNLPGRWEQRIERMPKGSRVIINQHR